MLSLHVNGFNLWFSDKLQMTLMTVRHFQFFSMASETSQSLVFCSFIGFFAVIEGFYVAF